VFIDKFIFVIRIYTSATVPHKYKLFGKKVFIFSLSHTLQSYISVCLEACNLFVQVCNEKEANKGHKMRFDHCFVCSSSIYGFWLSIWYLPTLLNKVRIYVGYSVFCQISNIWQHPVWCHFKVFCQPVIIEFTA
jgi:hypothetical protein